MKMGSTFLKIVVWGIKWNFLLEKQCTEVKEWVATFEMKGIEKTQSYSSFGW